MAHLPTSKRSNSYGGISLTGTLKSDRKAPRLEVSTSASTLAGRASSSRRACGLRDGRAIPGGLDGAWQRFGTFCPANCDSRNSNAPDRAKPQRFQRYSRSFALLPEEQEQKFINDFSAVTQMFPLFPLFQGPPWTFPV
jgi:hypothetical protein